jgi:hypothetical protein
MTTTVVKAIRINHPGDGAWIMGMVQGAYTPETDNSFMNHRDGRPVGGFAMCAYLGASVTVHMAGIETGWCSRDLMWIVFDFAFNQLGVRKVIAPVDSTNHIALAQDLRAGFELEATIRDATPDGHLMLLTMTKDRCKWLKHRSKLWRPGHGR